jgi:hypothetical protein
MRVMLERGWTQNACARDAAGNEVDELSMKAVSFDALGALTRAGRDAPREAVHDAIARLRAGIGFATLGAWNDEPGRTQAEVLALVDRAISSASADASPSP